MRNNRAALVTGIVGIAALSLGRHMERLAERRGDGRPRWRADVNDAGQGDGSMIEDRGSTDLDAALEAWRRTLLEQIFWTLLSAAGLLVAAKYFLSLDAETRGWELLKRMWVTWPGPLDAGLVVTTAVVLIATIGVAVMVTPLGSFNDSHAAVALRQWSAMAQRILTLLSAGALAVALLNLGYAISEPSASTSAASALVLTMLAGVGSALSVVTIGRAHAIEEEIRGLQASRSVHQLADFRVLYPVKSVGRPGRAKRAMSALGMGAVTLLGAGQINAWLMILVTSLSEGGLVGPVSDLLRFSLLLGAVQFILLCPGYWFLKRYSLKRASGKGRRRSSLEVVCWVAILAYFWVTIGSSTEDPVVFDLAVTGLATSFLVGGWAWYVAVKLGQGPAAGGLREAAALLARRASRPSSVPGMI